MLEPVTKKYQDDSNLESFKFKFFCDLCAKPVKAVSYSFKPPFKPKLFISASERRARELLWLSDHGDAYERANKEVLIFFNLCPVCGRRVCDDCFADEQGICIECLKLKNEKEEKSLSFLERAIKRGISRGVSQAVGKAVRTAVEPKATELANKTAARLDSASNNQTVQSTPGGFEGAMANLERAAQGYMTEVSKNMKICPSCETAATADNKFCPRCGTRLPDQTLAESAVCTSCGKQNDLGMKFCSACGTKLPSAIAEEQRAAAQFAGVMAEWDAKLPAYPKWNLGGSDPCIEQDDGYLWFCVTFPNNYLAQKAVEDYRALLRAEGFRPAGQYPSEEILFKKIGDVCYRADTEHCFEGGAESPTIYFSVGEPVGGFDYVKTEPTQAFNFKSLFR